MATAMDFIALALARRGSAGVRQQISSLEQKDELLETRIDQIVAPTGEAPSAAEVTDARIGADATVYSSLGAAVRGQVSALTNAWTAGMDTLMTGSDALTWEQGGLRRADGEEIASNAAIRTGVIPASVYRLTCPADYQMVIHSYDRVSGQYQGHLEAEGVWGTGTAYLYKRDYIFAEQSSRIYRVIMGLRAGGDITPSAGAGCGTWTATDDSLSISGKAADAKATGDRLGSVESDVARLFALKTVDPKSYVSHKLNISPSTGKWTTGSYDSRFVPIPPGAVKVVITAQSSVSATYALLQSPASVAGTTPDYATGGSRQSVGVGTSVEVNLPDDCTYLWVLCEINGTNNTPSSVVFRVVSAGGGEAAATIPLGLHTMPESDGVLNIIRRCRQMTDIKWTPAADLPRFASYAAHYIGAKSWEEPAVFRAGVEYTGIPYGRANDISALGYEYGYVGRYISFETFVSSVENPDSRVSKESRFSLADHAGPLYSAVCSSLACYALNVTYRNADSISNIPGMTEIGKVNDNGTLLDPANFQLADVLNTTTHTGIITDIVKDAAGNVTDIEVSEATSGGAFNYSQKDGTEGGIARRLGYPLARFYELWGGYTLRRYASAGSVPYTPSPYVNVGDELDTWRIKHFPVMPYEGSGFGYKTGHIPDNAVKLIISMQGCNRVRVYKDGTEITGSPFVITDSTESIDVTEISAGSYEAYLCDMSGTTESNRSYPCRWTIS